MEFEKSVSFKNWSAEKFEGIFGGDHYKFEAGGSYNVPQSLANHFAKQLAVRELHALGTVKGEMLSDIDVVEYMARCFPNKPTTQTEANTFERIDDVKDGNAKPAKEIEDANKTIEVEQKETSDDDEDDADDEKNNAGAPIFKKPVGRPKKSV